MGKEKIISLKSGENITVRRLTIEDATQCITLQESLTSEERKVYNVKEVEELKTFVTNDIVFGAFNESGDLIAQAGLKLIDEKSHFFFNRSKIPVSEDLDLDVYELCSLLVDSNHRGNGLQSALSTHLLDNFEHYSGIPVAERNILITAGCGITNVASTSVLLKSGLMLDHTFDVVLNDSPPIRALSFILPKGNLKCEISNVQPLGGKECLKSSLSLDVKTSESENQTPNPVFVCDKDTPCIEETLAKRSAVITRSSNGEHCSQQVHICEQTLKPEPQTEKCLRTILR